MFCAGDVKSRARSADQPSLAVLVQLQRDTVDAVRELVAVQRELLAVKRESLLLRRISLGFTEYDIITAEQ